MYNEFAKTITKESMKFENVSKLFDHAAHNGSSYLNGHCFVSIMLCIPVRNHVHALYLSVPLGYRKGMSVDENSLYVMEQIQKKSKYEILSTLPMISAPEVMSVLIQSHFFSLVKIENCLKINIK